MIARFRLLSARDDVAVAVDAATAGTALPASVLASGASVRLGEDIPAGHKVALRNIRAGEQVLKYGFPIGAARADIAAGSWVHTHNLATRLEGKLEYRYTGGKARAAESKAAAKGGEDAKGGVKDLGSATFRGFRRENGSVGIRNEIWILPTVGCVNGIAGRVADLARAELSGRCLAVEGVHAFAHPYGCSQLGEDHAATRTILAGLAAHPNAAGVLVLGLGCENNTVGEFRGILEAAGTGVGAETGRVEYLVVQEAAEELEEALAAVLRLAERASRFRREDVSVSELVVGLKCGGSDGFSGITANPLVGTFSDRLVAAGGTSILTEVPEMFGAETILMDRAADEAVFQDTVKLINDFKEYFLRHNQAVYENPSPGNKEGGISTLEDKSLGCVQKGGTAPVCGVYPYGGRVARRGLVLLSGPGNDIVSVTALAAAGAHLVLFTTGRGNPLGGPVPTLKISSNSDLAGRKPSWIDYDAGRLLETETREQTEEVEEGLYRLVLAAASGAPVRNETNGYREIAILKDGVTL